ncbi:MAG: DUF4366 domain-containing protein [Defluviitaleaceae bacterium]|nr:DUF4366 domain-containing protein [Defluviitaleaceae bacterium]
MIQTKRTSPTKLKIAILGAALLMCMSLFLAPITAYATETNPHIASPTVEAEFVGSLLRIRALSGFYAVEAVYVNNRRFNHRVDSALVIDVSGYIATGDLITVHAVDFAGNHSNTVLLTPPAPFQPPSPNNLTPDGHGEILDHLTNMDLIEFITIETPTGNIFYLVIDHSRNNNNVFFLNPVTEWDLLTLAAEAELNVPPHILQIPPTPPTITEHEPPPVTDVPAPEPEPPAPEESGGRAGTFIFLFIAGAGAFGVIYYLKILKPKKEREMYGDGGEDYNENDDFEDLDEFETSETNDEDDDIEGAYDVDRSEYVDNSDS